MQIAELPEEIAKRLELAWLLGLSFWETEAFLKERQAYLAYTEEDFEQERRDLDRLRLRGRSSRTPRP
jgi:hypothetical protein